MRILSLTQPWAQLMEIGAKRIETRKWSTPYRGPVLIHAAKRFPPEARDLCSADDCFDAEIRGRGFTATTLPLGVVVCCVELIDVVPTTWLLESHENKASEYRTEYLSVASGGTSDLPYGDYSDKRYAWITDRLFRFSPFITATGAQGLRRPSPDVERAALAQMQGVVEVPHAL